MVLNVRLFLTLSVMILFLACLIFITTNGLAILSCQDQLSVVSIICMKCLVFRHCSSKVIVKHSVHRGGGGQGRWGCGGVYHHTIGRRMYPSIQLGTGLSDGGVAEG